MMAKVNARTIVTIKEVTCISKTVDAKKITLPKYKYFDPERILAPSNVENGINANRPIV